MPIDPRYEMVLPYGLATPNRHGLYLYLEHEASKAVFLSRTNAYFLQEVNPNGLGKDQRTKVRSISNRFQIVPLRHFLLQRLREFFFCQNEIDHFFAQFIHFAQAGQFFICVLKIVFQIQNKQTTKWKVFMYFSTIH